MSTATYVQSHPRLTAMSPGELNGIALSLADELRHLRQTKQDREPRWFEVMCGLQSLVPDGVYEHYKSTPQDRKLYAVVGVGQSTEAPFGCWVTYAAQYEPFDGIPSSRPLLGSGEVKGFLDPAHMGIKACHRFKLIHPGGIEVFAGNIRTSYLTR